MRELQVILLLLSALALTVSCDTTEPSFDETIPEVYSLRTQVLPEGSGTVEPAEGNFEVNERIAIEAIPFEGYVFQGWEGDIDGNENPESVLLDNDKIITVRFSPRDYPLNITISGEGIVTEVVESRTTEDDSNQGVRQKAKNSTLQPDNDFERSSKSEAHIGTNQQVEKNSSQNTLSTTVRLKAEPEEGWYFSQWEGDLTGDVNPEIITVDEEKEVTAVFLQEETDGYSISVNVIGEGDVNKNPDRTYFNEGDEVTLTANPDQGWSFIEWQGDLTGSENSKTVTIEGDLNVTALFEVSEDPGMIITQQPSGTKAGAAISPAPAIKLTDGLGAPMEGVEIKVSLNENSFTAESSVSVATDNEGIASFNNLIIGTALSGYILMFEADEPGVTDISSNPFGVVAATGEPSNSSAAVPDGVAGMETVISIIVQDSYDNVITGIEGEIEVNISGANSASPPVNKSNSPGEYTASYIPENTGNDEVSIMLDGTPIDGSPFESEVVSSGADASSSTANVSDGTAGEETEITIFVNDQFGNKVSNVAGDLSVDVNGANSASPSVSETNTSGEYKAGYVPEHSGKDRISIQLNGSPIEESPFESDIASAAADASNSTATVSDGTAGEETEVAIVLKDQFGNSVSDATDELSVEISGANSDSPPVNELDSSGEYIASYTPENSGTDRVSIQLNGTPIDGSPFESEVDAAGVDPSRTVVSAEPDELTVGEVSVVTIELQDSFSNPIGGLSEDDYEITFTGDGSVGRINETSTTGVYEFEATSTTTGDLSLSVSANGTTLNDTPVITFEPGAPDELVIITQPENTQFFQPVAGPPAVLVKDEFENAVPGVEVEVSEERRADFLEGTLTVVTNESGIARFEDLVLNRIGGNFRLIFSAEGAGEIVSDRFQITISVP